MTSIAPSEYSDSRESLLLSFVFFPLFASLFLLQLFTVGNPYVGVALETLSLVGILGIAWSLRRERRRAWLFAIPALAVVLLLIGTGIARAAVGDPMPYDPVFWYSALSYLANALFLALPLAVAILLLGLLVAGVEHAGPLAIIAGLLGALALPSIVQNLAKMGDALHGIPIRSSGDPILVLYVLLVMPIIGVLLLIAGYVLKKSRDSSGTAGVADPGDVAGNRSP
jgi:hypothetical protein